MRVLQVIGAMDRGGAETVIMNLYRAIDRDRVQFDFLVHEQRECDYDAEIERMGGRIYRVPRYNILNGREYRRRCRAHFESHPEHEVVHGHIGSCAALYLAEAKQAGRATILHSHAQNYEKFPRKQAFNMMVKPSLGYADKFLACSYEAGLDRFGPRIVQGDDFSIMVNGIDVAQFACDEVGHNAAKAALGLEGNVVVGHVGRFVPVKNHGFLLEAFCKIREAEPRAKLLLLGRGPLEEDAKKQARDLGLDEDVLFCGMHDDVPRYVKAFDLFIFPSLSEGWAMAVVEAQAAGARCVMSTGVPEVALMTDAACRMPLDLGAAQWAEAGLDLLGAGYPRELCAQAVRSRGCDISDVASFMTSLYEGLAEPGPAGKGGAGRTALC